MVTRHTDPQLYLALNQAYNVSVYLGEGGADAIKKATGGGPMYSNEQAACRGLPAAN